ncbi:unnamed protein product, partial [Brachionus calyciflorus]
MSASIHLEKEQLKIENQALNIGDLEKELKTYKDNLQQIQIINCSIKRLDKEIFKDLKHLKILELDENLIEELPEKIFENNTNLQKISIKNNKLKEVDLDTFCSLSKLEILDLSKNKINCIRGSYSTKIPCIFDFSFNEIPRLELNWFKMSLSEFSIYQLNFESNKINNIKYCDTLGGSVINLMKNPIEEIFFQDDFYQHINGIKIENSYFEKLLQKLFSASDQKLFISKIYNYDNDGCKNSLILLWLIKEKKFENYDLLFDDSFVLDLEIINVWLNQNHVTISEGKIFRDLFYLYLKSDNLKLINSLLPLKSILNVCFRNDSKYLGIINQNLYEPNVITPDDLIINVTNYYIKIIKCFKMVRKNNNISLAFYLVCLLNLFIVTKKINSSDLSIELLQIFSDWKEFEDYIFIFLRDLKQKKWDNYIDELIFNFYLYDETEKHYLEYAIQEPNKSFYNMVEKKIEQKWNTFIRIFYYAKLLVFVIFLIIFTLHVENIEDNDLDSYGII